MDTVEISRLFAEGFDCSQVIVGHFADRLGIDRETALKASAAFGSGMCQGLTCGSVTGAMIVIGLRYGQHDKDHMEDKAVMAAKREEFFERFKKLYPDYADFSCKGLLGADISTTDGAKEIFGDGRIDIICTQLVADAVEILEEIISFE